MPTLSLMCGDRCPGRLVAYRLDQPWTFCRFRPTDAFAPYEALFAAELRALDGDDMDRWDIDYRRIADLNLALVSDDGAIRMEDFILHVSGGEAWFRY